MQLVLTTKHYAQCAKVSGSLPFSNHFIIANWHLIDLTKYMISSSFSELTWFGLVHFPPDHTLPSLSSWKAQHLSTFSLFFFWLLQTICIIWCIFIQLPFFKLVTPQYWYSHWASTHKQIPLNSPFSLSSVAHNVDITHPAMRLHPLLPSFCIFSKFSPTPIILLPFSSMHHIIKRGNMYWKINPAKINPCICSKPQSC